MRETDPERRRALLADLQATAADPVKARAHLLRSSMIAGLREAATRGFHQFCRQFWRRAGRHSG
jgi:hypothetical protein